MNGVGILPRDEREPTDAGDTSSGAGSAKRTHPVSISCMLASSASFDMKGVAILSRTGRMSATSATASILTPSEK
jgi:hypothetical protein